MIGKEAGRTAVDRRIDDPAQDQGRHHFGRPGDRRDGRRDQKHRPGPGQAPAEEGTKLLRRRAFSRLEGADQSAQPHQRTHSAASSMPMNPPDWRAQKRA